MLVCGDDDVDLPLALDRLAALGLEQVLCEGGPRCSAPRSTAGVVDELDLSIAPALVGGEPPAAGRRCPTSSALELRQLLEEDGVLFTRYGVNP